MKRPGDLLTRAQRHLINSLIKYADQDLDEAKFCEAAKITQSFYRNSLKDAQVITELKEAFTQTTHAELFKVQRSLISRATLGSAQHQKLYLQLIGLLSQDNAQVTINNLKQINTIELKKDWDAGKAISIPDLNRALYPDQPPTGTGAQLKEIPQYSSSQDEPRAINHEMCEGEQEKCEAGEPARDDKLEPYPDQYHLEAANLCEAGDQCEPNANVRMCEGVAKLIECEGEAKVDHGQDTAGAVIRSPAPGTQRSASTQSPINVKQDQVKARDHVGCNDQGELDREIELQYALNIKTNITTHVFTELL